MLVRPGTVVITAVLVSLGCAGDGTGLDASGNPLGPGGGSVDTAVSLSRNVQPVFTASCAFSGCHAGSSPAAALNLSQGRTFANTVNRPSQEVPALMRVRPSQPDSSYLIMKLEGTAGSAGGVATRMPLGGNPLPAAQIDLIRRWILAGALDD